MFRRILSRAPAVLAILVVVYTYTWYASHGRMVFAKIPWNASFGKPGEGFYAGLAEGFLRGQLSMAHEADPRLVAMADPFDYRAREDNSIPYLWDASLYKGRYYLYFSPLPALLWELPYRYVFGLYPNDTLAGAFFATWAFVMTAALVWRALANRRRHVPLTLWLLLLGLGTLIPGVIVFCRTYEIAILCGVAMSSTFAFALHLFLEKPSNSRLIWTSVWLALSIVARPNLAVLGLVLLGAVLVKRRADWLKACALMAIPLAVVGLAAASYNYARFGNPLEMGVKYQLTYMDMKDYRVCSCKTPREAVRLVNTAGVYLGAPLIFAREFPFVRFSMQLIDWKISFNGYTDLVGGLGVVVPVAFIGSVFAALLALRKKAAKEPGLYIVGGGWLSLLGLSTCWYVSARYELDFILLISAGAVIAIESGLTWLEELGVSIGPIRIAVIALACYSIVINLFLGFGAQDRFFWENPELYKRLGEFFG